jgi:hypothetical protein
LGIFVTTTSSFLEVSSSDNETYQLEQLKRVFCYPIALIVGIKKGILNYKTTNGIYALQKHIETLHRHVWSEWQEQEKDGPERPMQR